MHTAEELDRSVYRVSPDYPLDECARKKVEHRALVYSFRPFVRGIGDNASVSDKRGQKGRWLPAVAESREENKVPSAGWPATVVELPSGGCMCRTRINIAQHAARIEGKTSTARRVFRYSGRTTGGVLGSRRVSAGQRFTRCRRKPTKESATSTTMITRAEYAIQRTVTREDGRIRVTIQRRFKTSRYDGSRGTTNDSRWPRSW